MIIVDLSWLSWLMTSITFGCVVEISNYSSQWELQTNKHNWRGSGIETPCLKVDEVGWFWDNHSFHARFSYGKRAVWNRIWGWDFPMRWYLFVRRLYPQVCTTFINTIKRLPNNMLKSFNIYKTKLIWRHPDSAL